MKAGSRGPRLLMRSQLVAPVLALVREAGGDAAGLRARFDLPPSAGEDPEQVMPLHRLRDLLDAAEAEIGDPFLGLHLAARLPRGAYGVLEFTCRTAPTVRAALQRIGRYMGLLNELVTVTFEERGGSGVIEQRIVGDPLCVGRHGNEFFIATVLGGIRQLSGAPCVPLGAWFAHPRPADLCELLALLGTDEVRFDAGRNGMALPRAVLDLPLVTADPPLHSLLDRQAEQALAGRPSEHRLAQRVRLHIRETLGETPPTVESVAAALRLSRRTLQRRLADEGENFQDLLDEVRRELAVELVKDPRRPLGEIAYLLGFAELSSFLRAFRRWTGRAPSAYR